MSDAVSPQLIAHGVAQITTAGSNNIPNTTLAEFNLAATASADWGASATSANVGAFQWA
jgi:hypothetical protein